MNYLTTTKPDYKTAMNKAYQMLKKHKVNEFPIDIFEMIKSHDDLILITYEEMAKRLKVEVENIIEMCCSEEGCITYNHKINKYIIAYNDDPSKSITRIRFTLCHEYGHYILNHLIHSEYSTLMRYCITDDENDKFEKEANLFARELLAPTFLVNLIDPLDIYIISEYFAISDQASEFLVEHIHRCRKKGWVHALNTPFYLNGQFKQIRLSLEYPNFFHAASTRK